jgi:hypothetical protein
MIKKQESKILVNFLRHSINAVNLGVYNYGDIIDNFVDCFADRFECDPIELKKYLTYKFN